MQLSGKTRGEPGCRAESACKDSGLTGTDRPRTIAALALVFTLSSGCSTIRVHSDPAVTPGPYVGTKQALQKTKRYWYDYDYYGQVALVALDVPLSLVADTLLLPYDAYQSSN